MIENGGFPDQTYDAWTAKGASAYTGGLWVAATAMMAEMAKILNEQEDKEYFSSLFERSSKVYESLWNGQYFRYDTSGNYDNIIMADQLAGQWYARACNLGSIVAEENAKQCLKTIFDHNVKKFKEGSMGAVNGWNVKADTADYSSMQSCEVWIGTTYGLVASMIQEGLEEEAWITAKGVYDCVYEKFGYWFQTPEAWDEQGRYRSYAYMRPLAIWSIQWALNHK